MAISTDKTWADTRYVVDVTYYPIIAGSRGHRQTVMLPWDGAPGAGDDEALSAARAYFVAKYGEGEDEVVSASIRDRGPDAPIGADAVNRSAL